MTKFYDWRNEIKKEELENISNIIKENGVVIFPTETVYGVKFETPIDKMRTSRYAGDNIFCPHEVVAPKELDKGNFLVKIIIPAKIKSIIMEQLAQKGITTEYLFP